MPNIVEYHKPGALLTYTASAPLVGGQLVALTDDRIVGVAAANSVTCIGVAVTDAASGKKVAVASQGVWPLKAAGTIAQGARLKVGAAGTVVPYAPAADGTVAPATQIVGIALEDIADTATGRVKLTNLG